MGFNGLLLYEIESAVWGRVGPDLQLQGSISIISRLFILL